MYLGGRKTSIGLEDADSLYVPAIYQFSLPGFASFPRQW
jgi:hypothetical protein